jgi:hypothetical protein
MSSFLKTSLRQFLDALGKFLSPSIPVPVPKRHENGYILPTRFLPPSDSKRWLMIVMWGFVFALKQKTRIRVYCMNSSSLIS